MTDSIEMIDPVTGEIIDQMGLAEQLLAQARELKWPGIVRGACFNKERSCQY